MSRELERLSCKPSRAGTAESEHRAHCALGPPLLLSNRTRTTGLALPRATQSLNQFTRQGMAWPGPPRPSCPAPESANPAAQPGSPRSAFPWVDL